MPIICNQTLECVLVRACTCAYVCVCVSAFPRSGTNGGMWFSSVLRCYTTTESLSPLRLYLLTIENHPVLSPGRVVYHRLCLEPSRPHHLRDSVTFTNWMRNGAAAILSYLYGKNKCLVANRASI